MLETREEEEGDKYLMKIVNLRIQGSQLNQAHTHTHTNEENYTKHVIIKLLKINNKKIFKAEREKCGQKKSSMESDLTG